MIWVLAQGSQMGLQGPKHLDLAQDINRLEQPRGRHAALGIANKKEELENYTDVRFSKKKYTRDGHCNHPIPHPSFWPKKIDVTPIDLKPPTAKGMLGRPKKSRIKEPGEAPGAVRRANVLKYKVNNDVGHNKRTCPNKDVDLNVPISQPAKRMADRKKILGSSSSQPLPTNRDESMHVQHLSHCPGYALRHK
ncbi:hypothetical protein Salat_2077300 [Sesamum alatum]|uniref:Uncharacterized protein n=1 Tax=Sesamum alatum TaxID=300844 RepID=A0AAE1Y076_9LAMI|nr:hypothetical protein Salat_2077300 [Sesamum alatum]